MLMQAACSILEDPGIILASLLDRLNLTVWATSAVEDSRLPEESFELADEFLLLTIAILSERMFTDVSEVHSSLYLKLNLIRQFIDSVDSFSSWVLSCQKNKRGCTLNFY